MINIAIIVFSLFLITIAIFLTWFIIKDKGKMGFGFKIFLLFFFGVPVVILIRLKSGSMRLEREHQEYFDNFNISFAGRVYDYKSYEWRKDLQPGRGPKFNLYFLEILKSTVKNYDPSDTTANFYCIIRDSVALVIEETTHDSIFVGSVLYYNGDIDTMYNYYNKPIEKNVIADDFATLKYDSLTGAWKTSVEKVAKKKIIGYKRILYEKWQPKNIINQPHRFNIYKEYKDKWTPLIRNR